MAPRDTPTPAIASGAAKMSRSGRSSQVRWNGPNMRNGRPSAVATSSGSWMSRPGNAAHSAGDDPPRADGCREGRHNVRRIAAHDEEGCASGLECVCQRGDAAAHEPEAIGRSEAAGLEPIIDHEQGGDPVAVGLGSGQRGVVVQTQVSAEPDDTRRHGRSALPAPRLGTEPYIHGCPCDARTGA